MSLLSVDTVLYNPPARREEVLAARKKFSSSEGDHMTLLNIYRAFKKVNQNKVSKLKEQGKKSKSQRSNNVAELPFVTLNVCC